MALTDAGRRVDEVAAVFGLTATFVSMLRGRARAQGSAELVRRRGRPPKLTDRQVAQARVWAAEGWTQQGIADRLGVAQSVISELLARVGPGPVQESLPAPSDTEPCAPTGPSDTEPGSAPAPAPEREPVAPVAGSARIATGTYRCRYAGAMLLYPYLHLVGAEATFATLTGGPARRYDDLAVLTCATVGFALGVDTVEGTKHLRRAEAGAAVGLSIIWEQATLRARLSALAEGSDPLGLQRAFAAAQAELVAAERALPQLLAGPGTPKQKNAALPTAHHQIELATGALERATTALRDVPAKVLATELDPNAQRARPRLARRGLQMVLRLLAFNAEAWLAERFNAYLADPNEYRATLRKLLHQGWHIHYATSRITITLDRPDSPRVARALQLLTEELNTTPARLPGDRRPLTYHVTGA